MEQQKNREDTYLSGVPVNICLLSEDKSNIAQIVRWSLPNGDQIITTVKNYNYCFPFIFNHESEWLNAMNLLKRQRFGLNDDETKELTSFYTMRKAYFDKLKERERLMKKEMRDKTQKTRKK